jgi:syntaxin-binding protein 1
MAGGATYSESRVCYEVGNALNRDIVLATSHMVTPQLFIRQVSDLSVDKRRLDLPMDRPPPRAPAHLFERPAPPTMAPLPPPPGGSRGGLPPRRPAPGGLPGGPRAGNGSSAGLPPTQAMSSMSLASTPSPIPSNGPMPGKSPSPVPSSHGPQKPEKEKKKRGFLGIKNKKSQG